MNLESAFRFSSLLLALVGFSGLVLTGELPVGLALLGAVALGLALLHALGHGTEWAPFRLSHQTWTALLVAAFLFMWADLFWISGDLLPAGIHFLVVLMVHKLFTLRERKDFLHLYAISLVELLGAAALTLELWYAAVFMAYLLAAIWTLLLYHLRSEAEETVFAKPAAASGAGLITARFFWSTNGIALGALGLTLLIFLVMPRIGAGFFEKNRRDLIRLSGFSEKVDLGAVGSVKLDNTVVMRIEFPDRKGALSERVYFRGISYDAYDGRSWSNTLRLRQPLNRTREGEFVVPVARHAETGPGFRQDILVEALDTSVLFGIPFVESVKGAFPIVQVDGMGDVSLPYVPASRTQYTVYSVPTRLSGNDRARGAMNYPEAIRQRFLQLPVLSSRVAELARQVVQRESSVYSRVAALERHLKQNYQYSLDVGTAPTTNPVEEFLFVRKTGYCDHYATAMVMLLRTQGIPARLATGFAQGEWNEVGGYYTVRQRDAHAWVEVYFPDAGWVTFDPTPNIPIALPHPLVLRMGKIMDSIRLKWDRFIIRYSFRDQMAAVQGAREQGEAVRAKAAGVAMTVLRWVTEIRGTLIRFWQDYGWWMIGSLLIGGLCVGLALARLLHDTHAGKFVRSGSSTAQQMAAVKLYTQMLELLSARGLIKAPGVTPMEFANTVGREWGEAGDVVARLTGLYCRVRFGRKPLVPEDLTEAREWLARLHAVPR
jgi:transglutaminase-like putative cysteine protease